MRNLCQADRRLVLPPGHDRFRGCVFRHSAGHPSAANGSERLPFAGHRRADSLIERPDLLRDPGLFVSNVPFGAISADTNKEVTSTPPPAVVGYGKGTDQRHRLRWVFHCR